jgi:hypothetical protein
MDGNKVKANHGHAKAVTEVKERIPKIVGIEDAPTFLIDNKHLTRGYRKDFRSISSILRSCFMAHNETMNIWTHFLGALWLVWAMYYLTTFSMAHRSVEEHFKGMFYKKENYGGYLESVAENLKGCQSFSPTAGHILGTERISLQHLCHYLGAVKNQEFDQSFFTIHGAITKRTNTVHKDEKEMGKLKGMMLRAVSCHDTASS